MPAFRRLFDGRALLPGIGIALGGALILRALSSMPFWACFGIVLVAMLLNSLLAEWEDSHPGDMDKPT